MVSQAFQSFGQAIGSIVGLIIVLFLCLVLFLGLVFLIGLRKRPKSTVFAFALAILLTMLASKFEDILNPVLALIGGVIMGYVIGHFVFKSDKIEWMEKLKFFRYVVRILCAFGVLFSLFLIISVSKILARYGAEHPELVIFIIFPLVPLVIGAYGMLRG